MSKKEKQLVASIVKSLTENSSDWQFDSYVAKSKSTGIQIWITNVPIIDIFIYEPYKLSLSLLSKIKLYRAIRLCKSEVLTNLINRDLTINK